MTTSKNRSLIKAIIVTVMASICIPLFGSLVFSLITLPFVFIYGLVVAVVFFPMACLLTLPASVWFGIQTYRKGWFSMREAVYAVVVSATAASLILNSDDILEVNALPTIKGADRLIGISLFLAMGLAFAAIGALATQSLLTKVSLIRDPKSDATAGSDWLNS